MATSSPLCCAQWVPSPLLFLATSSGLTIAVAGAISQDVMSKRLEGVTAFRVSAVVAVVVPFLLAIVTRDVAVATVVGLAFAMAAATLCPLLVLGIWWRGLTDMERGALPARRTDRLVPCWTTSWSTTGGWFAALVNAAGARAVPLLFATMVVVPG